MLEEKIEQTTEDLSIYNDQTTQLFDIKRRQKHSNKAFNVLQDLFGDSGISADGVLISKKSKKISFFLLLFGGLIGLHRFYLGYTFYGVLHIFGLFFTWLIFQVLPDKGLGILTSIILVLWVLADFLAIVFTPFKDSQGRIVDR